MARILALCLTEACLSAPQDRKKSGDDDWEDEAGIDPDLVRSCIGGGGVGGLEARVAAPEVATRRCQGALP